MSTTLLTGFKPTGTLHLGNYLGAIKPTLDLAPKKTQTFIMVANLHALISLKDPTRLRAYTTNMAAALLAFTHTLPGVYVFLQSDVPEISELSQILATFTPKGLLNRSHAYKAATAQNEENELPADSGVNAGLFTYPILMAADILAFQATHVPVGKDQIQHLEIARDIAQTVNAHTGEDTLTLPTPITNLEISIPGTDGRKMSKSYGNVIPLFATPKEYKEAVYSIPTDSTPLDAPKIPESCAIYNIYKLLAPEEKAQDMANKLGNGGYGYGHAKADLLAELELLTKPFLTSYQKFSLHPQGRARDLLLENAAVVQKIAKRTLAKIRIRTGLH
jgi:tryptophanyl-tRNA synthetase